MQDIQELINASELTIEQRIKLGQMAAALPHMNRPDLENLFLEAAINLMVTQNQKAHLIRQRLNG